MLESVKKFKLSKEASAAWLVVIFLGLGLYLIGTKEFIHMGVGLIKLAIQIMLGR
jgi:hypothetical protein